MKLIICAILSLILISGCRVNINVDCYEKLTKCPDGYTLAGISGNVDYQCNSIKIQELYNMFAENNWEGNYTIDNFMKQEMELLREYPPKHISFSFEDRFMCGG